MVEMKLFDSILQIVPDFFKNALPENIKEEVLALLNKMDDLSLPSVADLLIFAKRFIIRCLDADLAPEQELCNYLSREDFWSSLVTDDMRENLVMQFPKSITLSHSSGGFLNELLAYLDVNKDNIDIVAQ